MGPDMPPPQGSLSGRRSLTSLSSLCQVLLDCAPRLGQELEAISFSFFCDKMARMFIPHFQEHLYRLRK